jgi:hypothetical protein
MQSLPKNFPTARNNATDEKYLYLSVALFLAVGQHFFLVAAYNRRLVRVGKSLNHCRDSYKIFILLPRRPAQPLE